MVTDGDSAPDFTAPLANGDGEITYAWRSDDPGVEPDYDAAETPDRNAA